MEIKQGFLRQYAELISHYRWWVISAVLVTTVFLAFMIKNLKIDMDPDIWAPQSHPYVKATKELEREFGGRNFTMIGIVPKKGDIYQPEILEKIKHIQNGIEQLPEAVRHNVVSLAARKVKDIKGTSDGMQARTMMDKIPQTKEQLERLRAAVAANPIYVNSLVSPDGKVAAVIADFKIDPTNPSYAALYSSIRNIVDKEIDDSVTIHFGGLPVELAWIEYYMMKMPIYFGLALLIIILVQYWSFRSIQGMLLPIVTGLVSVIWALGLMGLLDVHMDAMNTNTPILILAVAAGHAIQILKRYYEEYRRLDQKNKGGLSKREMNRLAVIESLVRVGPVTLTAGSIAVLTFYSLLTAQISVVRHFGVFAGTGVLAAIFLEMTLIPALRTVLPAPKLRESQREQHGGYLDNMLAWLATNLAGGKAPWILLSGLLLIMVMFAGVANLHVDNSLKRYHVEGSEVRTDDDTLNAHLGGTNSIFLLVDGKNQDRLKDPLVLKGMLELQEFLESQPHVGKTQSLADLVRRMNLAMHKDDPVYNKIPDDSNLIAQYLFLYSLSGDPQDFDNFVDNDYQKAAIWVYLREDSTTYADSLYQKAKPIIDRAFPKDVSVRMGGSLPQTIAINEVLVSEKFSNMLQMAAVVLLLSSLVLRSFVGGLFVVTPLLLVVLANFGLMGWFNIPIDMGTATTSAMAIGIGADYEIYLLFRFREELARTNNIASATRESLMTSGKAIIFVALSIAGGYAVLLTAGFGFYTRLSMMVIATMLISALSAIIFLRSLMMIFKPKFIFGQNSEKLFTAQKIAQSE